MSHFCLLRNPESYEVQDWDLVTDDKGREYWLSHFAQHMDAVLDQAFKRYGPSAKGRIDKARAFFQAELDQLRTDPSSLPGGKLRVIDICAIRERALRENKLPDPFGHIKQRENQTALEVYPSVVERLDAMDPENRWLHLVELILAGNVFDLGSKETMKYVDDGVDVMNIIEQDLPKRPWLVDDYESLKRALPVDEVAKWAKAVIFVDNAGADFVLGAMPLARGLALHGVQVVIAANEQPSLNDITVDEAEQVIEAMIAMDNALSDLVEAQMFELASSGNDLPLIDLSNVSDELNAASEGADLVILEGMGRSIESNYQAEFSCDVIRLAMLKDAAVAERLGGKSFDAVCRYDPIEPLPDPEDTDEAESEQPGANIALGGLEIPTGE